MPFQPGQSGNPYGRPRGSRNRTSLAVREWATGIVEDPQVQARLHRRCAHRVCDRNDAAFKAHHTGGIRLGARPGELTVPGGPRLLSGHPRLKLLELDSATLIRWSSQPSSSSGKSFITRNSTIVAPCSTWMQRFKGPMSGTNQWHDLVRQKTGRGITYSSTGLSTQPTSLNAISNPKNAVSRSSTP